MRPSCVPGAWACIVLIAVSAGRPSMAAEVKGGEKNLPKAFYGTVVRCVDQKKSVFEFRLGSRGKSVGTFDVSVAGIVRDSFVPVEKIEDGRRIVVVARKEDKPALAVEILYVTDREIKALHHRYIYLSGVFSKKDTALVDKDGNRRPLVLHEKTMIVTSAPGTIADVNLKNKYIVFVDAADTSKVGADGVARKIVILPEQRGHKAYSALHRPPPEKAHRDGKAGAGGKPAARP